MKIIKMLWLALALVGLAVSTPAQAQKISNLPAASGLSGSDVAPFSQSGSTRKVTSSQISGFVQSSLGVREVLSADKNLYVRTAPTTVTMTIASPAVVNWALHGLSVGDAVIFDSSGSLPTGVSKGATYYVIAAGLTANAFEFSASIGGSAVNTSGSQNGTHKAQTGNDAYDCTDATKAHACLTPQHVIDYFAQHYDLHGFGGFVRLSDGYYTPGDFAVMFASMPFINGNLWLYGNTITPANVTIDAQGKNGILSNVADVWFAGFHFIDSVGGGCALRTNTSEAFINFAESGDDFGSMGASGIHMCATGYGTIQDNGAAYTISGGGGAHEYAEAQGFVDIEFAARTLTNSPIFTGGFAKFHVGGVVYDFGGSFTGPVGVGTKKYIGDSDGTLLVDSLTSLPGDISGTTAGATVTDTAGTVIAGGFRDILNADRTYYVDHDMGAVTMTIASPAVVSKTAHGLTTGDRVSFAIIPNTASVTVTIASPAVVTWNAHGFAAGQPIVFHSSGSLPTGITFGTTYYVIAAGLAANTFEFSATVGGAAVNTSGTQSGSHFGSMTGALPTGATAGQEYYVIAAGLTANAFEFSATSGGAAVNTSGSQSGTFNARTVSDSHTCLADTVAAACLKAQHVYDLITGTIDTGDGHTATVQYADGLYLDNNVALNTGWVGTGEVDFNGNDSHPANVTLDCNTGNCFRYWSANPVRLGSGISGFKLFSSGNGQGVHTAAPFAPFLDAIEFGSFGTGIDIVACCGAGPVMYASNITVSGGAFLHVFEEANGYVDFEQSNYTILDNPAFTAWVRLDTKATMYAIAGMVYNGSATGLRFSISGGSTLYADSITSLPGNAAGVIGDISSVVQSQLTGKFTNGGPRTEIQASVPSVSSGAGDCGTSPSIVGNDGVGRVTVGSSTNGGKCTITFTAAWTNAPLCFANNETTANLLRSDTPTTAALILKGTLTAGDKLGYRCVGYQ